MLSIGTGTVLSYVKGKSHDWGLAQWAQPLINLLLDASMGIADYQCRQILGTERYHRVAPYSILASTSRWTTGNAFLSS
jgi:hypothetical protein